jgi:CHASE3 domain sensor protein
MAISIFWRLILGITGILFLAVAVCVYTIIQLGTLSQTARSALDVDQRMVGYQEALTDSFLSEVRYGGKYIFTHTEDRHAQMRQFKNDFDRYMGEIKSLAESAEITASLSKIDRLHRQYHELLDREVAYIRAKQTYAQSRYQQERDKVFETALGELDRLKSLLKGNLEIKLEGIDRAARASRRIGILTTILVAILGTWFSFRLSKNMTMPLQPLEQGAADFRKAGHFPTAIAAIPSNPMRGSLVEPILRPLTTFIPNAFTLWSRCLARARSLAAGKVNHR